MGFKNTRENGNCTNRVQTNETLTRAVLNGDAFIDDNGQVFINAAFIGNGGLYGWKIGSLIPRWSDEPSQQEGGVAVTYTAPMRVSVGTPESEDEKLAETIREVIRDELKAGGMLWRR